MMFALHRKTYNVEKIICMKSLYVRFIRTQEMHGMKHQSKIGKTEVGVGVEVRFKLFG